MNVVFVLLTVVFIVISAAMILIILVQRPQGGGLAGAFGGAGGGGTDTVFGGRVGDALTVMTVVAFLVYLGLAVGLNLMPIRTTTPTVPTTGAPIVTGPDGQPMEMMASGPPPGGIQSAPSGQPITTPPPPVDPAPPVDPQPETNPNGGE